MKNSVGEPTIVGELVFNWQDQQIEPARREIFFEWLNDLQRDIVVSLFQKTGVERAVSCSISAKQQGSATCCDILFGRGATKLADCENHKPRHQLGDYASILLALEEIAHDARLEYCDPSVIVEASASDDVGGTIGIPFCWVEASVVDGEVQFKRGQTELSDAPARPLGLDAAMSMLIGVINGNPDSLASRHDSALLTAPGFDLASIR